MEGGGGGIRGTIIRVEARGHLATYLGFGVAGQSPIRYRVLRSIIVTTPLHEDRKKYRGPVNRIRFSNISLRSSRSALF